jgi:hypothetical protein
MPFEVDSGDGIIVTMKMDAALPFERRARRPVRGAPMLKREPFALYFLGPPDRVLPQGTYTFRGPTETFEGLFIVPIGRDEVATEYEAIFS